MSTVRTKVALAKVLGVTVQTIRRWARDPAWTFTLDGPWDSDVIARWRDHTLHPDPVASLRAERRGETPDKPIATADGADADSQSITVIDRRLKLARAKLVELQREILDGKHIERDVHVGTIRGLCGMFVGVLQELSDVLPDQLSGLPPGEVEKRLRVWCDDAIARLRSHATIPVAVVDETPVARKRGRPRKHPGRPRANRQGTV